MDVIEPTAPKEPQDLPTGSINNGFDPVEYKIESYFRLQNLDTKDKEMVRELKSMFGGDEVDIVDLLWGIKNVENRIGTPQIGISRLQHVYNFAKLNHQIQSLEKERDLYGV